MSFYENIMFYIIDSSIKVIGCIEYLNAPLYIQHLLSNTKPGNIRCDIMIHAQLQIIIKNNLKINVKLKQLCAC